MAKQKFARILPIKDIVDKHMTLKFFNFVESVFGEGIHVAATLNDTDEDIVFTTGSKAIVTLFKLFDEPDDVIGMQIAVRNRGQSYSIEDLDEE